MMISMFGSSCSPLRGKGAALGGPVGCLVSIDHERCAEQRLIMTTPPNETEQRRTRARAWANERRSQEAARWKTSAQELRTIVEKKFHNSPGRDDLLKLAAKWDWRARPEWRKGRWKVYLLFPAWGLGIAFIVSLFIWANR
jgi:uncharacterized membrane protein YccC